MSEPNRPQEPSIISIEILPNGDFKFSTNCQNKITILGMLDLAKHFVLSPEDAKRNSPIVVARGVLPN